MVVYEEIFNGNWTTVLLFVSALLLYIMVIENVPKREPFQNSQFELKTNDDIYDTFYVDIYDSLVYSVKKNKFEINSIIEATKLNKQSNVLEVGCGTGHHAAELSNYARHVTAIDNSPHMISKCMKKYASLTNVEFIRANALNPYVFQPDTFDTIVCLYFTIYYFKNKRQYLRNCFSWLKPGGIMVIHLVDRDNFDPVVPPASPFLFVNPQSVAKKRITQSSVVFNDFRYNSNFIYKKENDVAVFAETFKTRDGNTIFRKNEHIFYMEQDTKIVKMAEDEGFRLVKKIDLVKASYEYQYLYVFKKK